MTAALTAAELAATWHVNSTVRGVCLALVVVISTFTASCTLAITKRLDVYGVYVVGGRHGYLCDPGCGMSQTLQDCKLLKISWAVLERGTLLYRQHSPACSLDLLLPDCPCVSHSAH